MARQSVKALYPGSFDALTYGHLDLVNRASRVFDSVVVAIAHNEEKKPVFTVEERLEALNTEVGHLVNVEVTHFSGLTVDFAIKIGSKIIIRGLRATSDFEVELQMAMMNRSMESRVETLFLAPSPETSFVSSSLIKEILIRGGDVSKFVPPATERMLRKVYAPVGRSPEP